MKRKALTISALVLAGFLFVAACNNEQKPAQEPSANDSKAVTEQPETHGTQIQPGEVELKSPLDAKWVASGKAIYEMKCQACHKLTDERVVGPGWKDVTKRRKPEWIMNMITNVDMMLETDPEAQKLLEQCLVRMPNQNISKAEAREILEFMRANDGEK
jgi:cytochrome c551/c552